MVLGYKLCYYFVFLHELKLYTIYCGKFSSTRSIIKVPIAPNYSYKDVCLQNTSKPHSYHLKIW